MTLLDPGYPRTISFAPATLNRTIDLSCYGYNVKVEGKAGIKCSGTSPGCGPLSPGSIPGPGAVCPFGFQSKLASAGFSPGTPVFLLHLKLGFLNLFLELLFVLGAMALRLGTLTFLG